MYYNFDLINLMVFAAGCIILWANHGQITGRMRSLYAMIVVTAIYLMSAIYCGFRWYATTGEEILRAHEAFDYVYFSSISILPGLFLLYFVDLCIRRPKHIWLMFLPSVVLMICFLVLNPSLGIMYYYEDGLYHRGPLLPLSHSVWALYVVLIIWLLIKYRRLLGLDSVISFVLFIIYEIAIQVYQFFAIDFYCGGVAFATGVLFLIIILLLLDNGRDPLTGVSNRTGFAREAAVQIDKNRHTSYVVVVLDILNFKNINERFGFDVGNQVLKHVAGYIRSRLFDDENIARFHSDRFYLLLREEHLSLLRESVPISTCAPEIHDAYDVFFFAGICPVNDPASDVIVLADRATFALERVKGDFHSHHAYFDDKLKQKFDLQTYIAQEMRNALAQERFEVYLQPVYDTVTGRIVSAEALTRWHDEQYGFISPADFIPLFERNGFINELDIYVWGKVCEHIAQWRKEGIAVCPVSVNISRVDLQMPGFISIIESLLEKYDLTPQDLKIEITESAFVREESFTGKLQKLHELGFQIMMDDFGTGYSNFNTFAAMPVDILKADIGFMHSMEASRSGKIVLATIAEMAHELNITIVAEGVETKEQLDYLKAIGCAQVQGYYYARPMPAADFREKLLQTQADA